MKTTSLLISLVILLSLPLSSRAADVAIFTGRNRLKVHDDAMRGFMSVYPQPAEEFEVSEKDIPELREKLAASAPKLIFAIGSDALAAALEMGNIPVVFALVERETVAYRFHGPATGVDLLISPEKQVEAIHNVLPGAERIGVVYNPAKTGSRFRSEEEAASAVGLKIIGIQASSAAGAINGIKSLEGKIDALWLLPDVSLLDYETVKYAMLFSFSTKVPVIAPSARFVENGALLGLGVDAFDIGVQAGQIAKGILSGRKAQDIPVAFARKIVLSVNIGTARKFGIRIPDYILKKCKIYGRRR